MCSEHVWESLGGNAGRFCHAGQAFGAVACWADTYTAETTLHGNGHSAAFNELQEQLQATPICLGLACPRTEMFLGTNTYFTYSKTQNIPGKSLRPYFLSSQTLLELFITATL